jgi:hypothetical protein
MEDPVLEYQILETVYAHDGRLTQRHISNRIGRSVASVNFSLRLLAVMGFIEISGANPRNLRYHLTPRGMVQKSRLAYDFLKRQRAMYDEVRSGVIEKLKDVRARGMSRAAVYGWTPFTESAILFLVSEGVKVTSIYGERMDGLTLCNRIQIKHISEFEKDCDVVVLMEPLPDLFQEMVTCERVVCFPDALKARFAAFEEEAD